jgi:hypothetical protein
MRGTLSGVEQKLERANHHVQELNAELQAFFATNPYVGRSKRDPKTRQVIYYMVSVRETPPVISALAGEILQSLRSALDHLAYQLVLVGTGKPGPFPYVYYPIFESAEKYEAGKLGQIKGMRKKAIEAIDATKPYKGGNDALWKIDRLNKIDKHRLLIAVGSVFTSFDVAHYMSRQIGEPGLSSGPSVFIGVTEPRPVPLKAGDIVFTDRPDAEPDEQQQFRFAVAFSEPGIAEGETVIETLKQMTDLVGGLLPSFRRLLS